MKVYLHIGAGKCGSSSIQNYFSNNVSFSHRSAYCVLNKKGEIFSGKRITLESKRNIYDYQASSSFRAFDSHFEKACLNITTSLSKLSEQFDVIVLSNEGWLEEVNSLERIMPFFDGCDVEVLLFVRPPVEWVNSAWWQWGQWCDIDINKWYVRNIAKTLWFDYYKSFSALEGITAVSVFAIEGDVLNQLSSHLDFDYESKNNNANKSSDYRLLSFFKENRKLRPGPHDSQLEFCINRHIQSVGKPDWVLSCKQVGHILNQTQDSNDKLLTIIKNPDAVKNDPRWWGRGFYKDADKWLVQNRGLSREDLSSMLVEAYEKIFELDLALRNKKAKGWLNKIQKK